MCKQNIICSIDIIVNSEIHIDISASTFSNSAVGEDFRELVVGAGGGIVCVFVF